MILRQWIAPQEDMHYSVRYSSSESGYAHSMRLAQWRCMGAWTCPLATGTWHFLNEGLHILFGHVQSRLSVWGLRLNEIQLYSNHPMQCEACGAGQLKEPMQQTWAEVADPWQNPFCKDI